MPNSSHSHKTKTNHFTGPPEVIPWLQVTRDSPVELDRKMGYIVGWHTSLAKAEDNLKKAEKENASRAVMRERRAVVDNNRKWLKFSIATLDNHVRHALARCEPESADGKLLREEGKQRSRAKKRKNAPVRFRKMRKDAARKIRHYATILEEYKLAKAAAAGHSGSNDALVKLIAHAQHIVKSAASASFREKDDAEQAAIMSLLKAAKSFSHSHKGFARFNTYAWWKTRRAVEARSSKDCKPGMAIVQEDGEKKLISIASINAAAPGKDESRDAFHPPTEETNDVAKVDVQRALKDLSEIERVVAVGVLMQQKSLRQVARESGYSSRKLRTALDRAQEKLRRALEAHRAG